MLVHRPATVPRAGSAGRSLVIALHGNWGTAERMPTLTGLTEAADELGFSVAYPQGEDREWGVEIAGDRFRRDRALLRSLVDAVSVSGCVDPDRVIVTGFSLGGILANGLACTDADRFHAVVAVSSREVSTFVPSGPQEPQPCSPSRPVTFVAYNSTQDEVIPYGAGHAFGWAFPSVEDWVAGWARRNACSGGSETTASITRLVRGDAP